MRAMKPKIADSRKKVKSNFIETYEKALISLIRRQFLDQQLFTAYRTTSLGILQFKSFMFLWDCQ